MRVVRYVNPVTTLSLTGLSPTVSLCSDPTNTGRDVRSRKRWAFGRSTDCANRCLVYTKGARGAMPIMPVVYVRQIQRPRIRAVKSRPLQKRCQVINRSYLHTRLVNRMSRITLPCSQAVMKDSGLSCGVQFYPFINPIRAPTILCDQPGGSQLCNGNAETYSCALSVPSQ